MISMYPLTDIRQMEVCDFVLIGFNMNNYFFIMKLDLQDDKNWKYQQIDHSKGECPFCQNSEERCLSLEPFAEELFQRLKEENHIRLYWLFEKCLFH